MAEIKDVLVWSGSEWLSLEGPQGNNGQKATVEAGTTTTGAAGSNADVENVGTDSDAIFNFTIPTGAKGPDGEAGTQQVGKVDTVQLNAGSDAAVVINNSGGATKAIWDYTFSLAPGADGKDGAPGQDGAGVNILGEKENEAALPDTGNPGDAWLVLGDLWVWDAEESKWVDVGRIQGKLREKTAKKARMAMRPQCQPQRPPHRLHVINRPLQLCKITVLLPPHSFRSNSICQLAVMAKKANDGEHGDNAEVYVQKDPPSAKAAGALWLQSVT